MIRNLTKRSSLALGRRCVGLSRQRQCPAHPPSPHDGTTTSSLLHRRFFFTNTDRIHADDPYAQLGLQWGDGSTLSDIKAAYRKRAAQLHPDVNPHNPQAQRDFQRLQRAYEVLTKNNKNKHYSNYNGSDSVFNDDMETAWRFGTWRRSDDIATERTDVAGVAKRRPIPPAPTTKRRHGSQLGHPSGRGSSSRRGGEYLGSNCGPAPQRSSSVGRGMSKWVTPKEFVPWKGGKTGTAAASKEQVNDCDKGGDSLER